MYFGRLAVQDKHRTYSLHISDMTKYAHPLRFQNGKPVWSRHGVYEYMPLYNVSVGNGTRFKKVTQIRRRVYRTVYDIMTPTGLVAVSPDAILLNLGSELPREMECVHTIAYEQFGSFNMISMRINQRQRHMYLYDLIVENKSFCVNGLLAHPYSL